MRWLRRPGISVLRAAIVAVTLVLCGATASPALAAAAPSPMVDQNHRAEWVFAFKFNVATFPTTGTLTSPIVNVVPVPNRVPYTTMVVERSDGPTLGVTVLIASGPIDGLGTGVDGGAGAIGDSPQPIATAIASTT